MKHTKIITTSDINEFNKANIPKACKTYHFYDDGKSSLSRHYYATVIKVIPYGQMAKTKCYRKVFNTWKKQTKQLYWTLNKTTDYFVIAEVPFYCEYPLYFARSKTGGWFSIESKDFFSGGLLDVDNKKTNQILEHDPKYIERCKDIAVKRLMERITNKFYEDITLYIKE